MLRIGCTERSLIFTPTVIQSMLAQFQARYPMGSLITELLTIHDGNYVVRALVQVGGTTLATGMAASPTLELAEDQARVRALQVLGLEGNGDVVNRSAPAQLSAYGLQVHWSGNHGEMPDLSALRFGQPTNSAAIAPTSYPQHALPTSSTPEARAERLPAKPQQAVSPSLPVVTSYPYAGLTPDEPTDPAPTPNPTPVKSPPQPSVDLSSIPTPSTPHSLTPSPSDSPPSSSPASSPSQLFPPDDDFDPFLSIEDEEFEPPSVDDHPTYTPEPRAAVPAPQPAPDPSVIVDRSDEIAQIDVEMRRLGWTKLQGRKYLEQTYGKRSRQQLTDQELLEFLEYLASQASPSESPF